MSFRFSVMLAMLRFALMLGFPPLRANGKLPKESATRIAKNSDFFAKHEILGFTNYNPDVALIRQNGVKVFMAAGKWTLDKNKFYDRTVPILADRLGCEQVTLPGHHTSYIDMPKEWAATLRTILHKAVE